MDRLIEYFQQFPLFFWALAALAAAMAVLGVLLIVRAVRHRAPQTEEEQEGVVDEMKKRP